MKKKMNIHERDTFMNLSQNSPLAVYTFKCMNCTEDILSIQKSLLIEYIGYTSILRKMFLNILE